MSTTPGPNPLFALTPGQVNRAQSAQWRDLIRQALMEARCACPGFLTTDMDAVEQTVTVQLAIQERVRVVPKASASASSAAADTVSAGMAALSGGVAGAVKAQWWDVPPIVHVPIMTPRGGGYAVTLPLKKGDEGMLIFCDACIDLWWRDGQTNSPVANNTHVSSGSQRQNEIRRHYIHDCGFYPGLWNHKRLLEDYSTDSLQIRSDDGAVSIDVSLSGVRITAPIVFVSDNLQVGNGATGSFTAQTGQVITVQDGVITNIY
jgi:hypothetical protein